MGLISFFTLFLLTSALDTGRDITSDEAPPFQALSLWAHKVKAKRVPVFPEAALKNAAWTLIKIDLPHASHPDLVVEYVNCSRSEKLTINYRIIKLGRSAKIYFGDGTYVLNPDTDTYWNPENGQFLKDALADRPHVYESVIAEGWRAEFVVTLSSLSGDPIREQRARIDSDGLVPPSRGEIQIPKSARTESGQLTAEFEAGLITDGDRRLANLKAMMISGLTFNTYYEGMKKLREIATDPKTEAAVSQLIRAQLELEK